MTARAIVAVSRCARPADYEAAVRKAGGTPRCIGVGDSPASALDGVQGLLLTGGHDVDPAWFGAARHPSCVNAEPGRDAFELSLLRLALGRDLPVLAICRGLQVMNVACGGTLVQDLPAERPSPVIHQVPGPMTRLAHPVRVDAAARLRQWLTGPEVWVNSRHHQAIAVVGRSLVAAAWAPDGVVEAAEIPSARFCVGVQWHPESFVADDRFDALFDAFVSACR